MDVQKPKPGHKFFRFRKHSKIILAEITDDWGITIMSDITFPITKGTTPTTEGQNFVRSGIPFFKVESINEDGTINEEKLGFISKETHEKLKRSQIRNHDILFSIAGTLGRTYLVESRYVPSNTNQALAIIRTKSNSYSKEFLKYVLTSNLIKKQILIEKTTLAQSNLSLKQVSEFRLMNPPILEQQKTASILSNIDHLIQNTNQQIEQTQLIKKGMMRKLLTKGLGHTKNKKIKWYYGEEIEIPLEWDLLKLGDVCELLDSLRVPIKESDRSVMHGNIPYYGASGVIDYVNDFIFDEKLLCLAEDGENLRSRVVPVAFTIEGKSWVNNHAHVLRPKEQRVEHTYLENYLNLINYLPHLDFSAQPKLNQNQLKKIKFLCPPISEQKQIAVILSHIDSNLQKQKLNKSNLEILKKGLMQKLLTGKIRIKF